MSLLSKQSDRFAETEVDDEIVLMRLDNGEFFSLTGTGAATWRLIDGTRDREAVLAELARQYDCSAADIAADVDEFLAALRDMGLLTIG